ncbi:MAG TPA: hypothetical protein VM010_07845 [Chitinophagaceae bacterium]|nr:hypothetical protein [Chitinophagaceae bacterium]
MDIISEEAPLRQPEKLDFPVALRTIARIVSVVFHPLFIPVYLSYFLIYINPVFPAFEASDKLMLLIRFIVMYTVFPLATILLTRALGFVQTIYLKTQRDRIIPYIACGMYYFWMWYVLRNQTQFGNEVVMLALAIFLASSGGLLANTYIKVSMHALSVGVMLTYIILLGFVLAVSFGFFISVALLVAGAVCTARLLNSDHYPIEVYAGLAIGILAQLLAYYFVY